VQSLLGTAGTATVGRLVDHLVRHDAAAALAEFDEACADGVDPGQLVTQLLDYLRDAMVLAAGGDAKLMRLGGDEELEVTTRAAEQFGLDTTMAAIAVLDQTLTRMRQSTHVRTLVEIALVRICRLENLDALAGLIADLKSGTAPAMPKPTSAQPAAVTTSAPKKNVEPMKRDVVAAPADDEQLVEPARVSDSLESPAEEVAAAVEDAPIKAQAESTIEREETPTLELDATTADATWTQVVAQLHQEGNLLASHAECSQAVQVDDAGCLVVSFTEQARFHRSACERPEAKSKLEQSIRQLVGASVRLRFDTAAGVPAPVLEETETPSPREQQKAIEEHPMVQRTAELFDAEVIGPPRKAR
jgi:DNA polymerase-3 subunit gamma/tau